MSSLHFLLYYNNMLLEFENLVKTYDTKITGVIQVGAHYGQEIEIFKRNNISNIICFEPVPSTFQILKESVKDNAILINLALGNENKKVMMNIETANNGQSNSILKPSIHLTQYPHIRFNSEIEVEMMRMDDFLENYNRNNSLVYRETFNFLILDVQGYELEVLKGAEKTLNEIDYVLCEVNRGDLYKGSPHVDEIDDYLKKYNFKRVETNWAGDIWGDAFYIRNNS